MPVINTNITSLIAQKNLSSSQSALTTAMERLSSGMRINSAKDDAAGQAIANRMSSQITGLTQAQRNANDGISVAQTTEGALDQINDNLQRIRELTVQAQNGTNSSEDLTSIQNEIAQRLDEIDRISQETEFNGVKVLSKDTNLNIQVGANDGQSIGISLKQINAKTLGLDGFNVDGSGATQNSTATVTSLEGAGAVKNSTTGNYVLTTTFDEASLERMLGEMKDGDVVTVGSGASTAVEYTFNTASGSFTYTANATNAAAYGDLADELIPPTGSSITGTYEFADGNVATFAVDASGKLTLDGQAAYVTATGELTNNATSGATQATLEDLFATVGAGAAGTDTSARSLTVGGVTYTGAGTTAGLSYTDTATSSDVLAASASTVASIEMHNGITSATIDFDNTGAQSSTGTQVYVDEDGQLTTVGSYTTTFAVNADTGEVTVVDNSDTAGDYALEEGATVYVGSNGRLTTSTTSKGDVTEDPLAALDAALASVDALRSDLGAIQNRFDSAINNLSTTTTNLSAARSRIEDADYAVEVANMTKAQILQQAGTSVLAQANQVPQSVLSLLG
ncbi:Flagellin [Azotobacter vinelandii CA]|uniref:Flagellin n=2 Tax=Azotobacter vinelandii TaxID=354 RepID=C1DKU0_AZOVD|nr:flagellin [Azotobacter vinelandii]ACO78942.1 Flagellin [Azotobacter vinelandii DJ]AGK13491.1 Flagellin [Azotobacter vinelandii CA]AGK17905.1 Flagellin [Azotobacter vinelandii CA6]SFY12111.1 flagellin [Azotobacter vinelandii]GLK59742.1 flagellin [Azotobacter vinelandii]